MRLLRERSSRKLKANEENAVVIQLFINGISMGAVYAIVAVGFALVFSILRFSNFAHGGIISVCAYAVFFFQKMFDKLPNIFVLMAVSALFGALITLLLDLVGFMSIRRNNSPRIYYFVSSITFGILAENVLSVRYGAFVLVFPHIFEVSSFTLFGLSFSTLDMFTLATTIVLLAALMVFIQKTKLGLAIRTVSIDPMTSNLMGINSAVVITSTFMIAGMLAGIGGVLLATRYSVYPTLGSGMIAKAFIASVIGGLGSLSGAILGSILLGVVEMYLVYFFGSSVTTVLLLVIMIVFLLLRPQGISGVQVQDKA